MFTVLPSVPISLHLFRVTKVQQRVQVVLALLKCSSAPSGWMLLMVSKLRFSIGPEAVEGCFSRVFRVTVLLKVVLQVSQISGCSTKQQVSSWIRRGAGLCSQQVPFESPNCLRVNSQTVSAVHFLLHQEGRGGEAGGPSCLFGFSSDLSAGLLWQ